MNKPRILLGAGWLASVALVYFLGQAGQIPPLRSLNAGSETERVALGVISDGSKKDRTMRRTGNDLAPEEKRGEVAQVVARARLQLARLGGVASLHALARAAAPFEELDRSQIPEALAEVERTVRDPQQRFTLSSTLLGRWAEEDGAAAMAYLEQQNDWTQSGENMRAAVLTSWAAADPDAAWRWSQIQPTEGRWIINQSLLLETLFTGLTANDVDHAFARLALVDESARAWAVKGILASATDDLTRRRVLERAGALPRPEREGLYYRGIVDQWAANNLEEALGWIETRPAEERQSLLMAARTRLIAAGPEQGAARLLEHAQPEEKPQIYDMIVSAWCAHSVEDAGAWLARQPQGEELDRARVSYLFFAAQKDPPAALAWAQSIVAEDRRLNAFINVYRPWSAIDLPAANAALDALGLPPETIRIIKQPPELTFGNLLMRNGITTTTTEPVENPAEQ